MIQYTHFGLSLQGLAVSNTSRKGRNVDPRFFHGELPAEFRHSTVRCNGTDTKPLVLKRTLVIIHVYYLSIFAWHSASRFVVMC